MVVDMHEPGGVSLDVNGTPAPTKGTASIELAGRAIKATTAQPEALDLSPLSPVPPWVQWSNELAREMYIKRALNRLQLQYPDDS